MTILDPIHVIFNPAAGQGRAPQLLPALRAQLAGIGQVKWFHTSQPGDACQLAAGAVRERIATVVAVGGDGTVNEIVNGLMTVHDQTSLPRLAIIPAGSSNSFALELGIADVGSAFERLCNGTTRSVDIGQVTDVAERNHYFCVSAGVGFIAVVAEERYRVRWVRGRLLYLLAALRAIVRRPGALSVALGFDGGLIEQHRLLTLSINNCATVGGYPLSPNAEMSDGCLDVLLVREISPVHLIRLILDARTGQHVRHKEVVQRRLHTLKIIAAKPVPLHLDGEIHLASASDALSLQISVLPNALTVAA